MKVIIGIVDRGRLSGHAALASKGHLNWIQRTRGKQLRWPQISALFSGAIEQNVNLPPRCRTLNPLIHGTAVQVNNRQQSKKPP